MQVGHRPATVLTTAGPVKLSPFTFTFCSAGLLYGRFAVDWFLNLVLLAVSGGERQVVSYGTVDLSLRHAWFFGPVEPVVSKI